MGDDVIGRVEALVADYSGFSDDAVVYDVRLGDLRELLSLARSNRDAGSALQETILNLDGVSESIGRIIRRATEHLDRLSPDLES